MASYLAFKVIKRMIEGFHIKKTRGRYDDDVANQEKGEGRIV